MQDSGIGGSPGFWKSIQGQGRWLALVSGFVFLLGLVILIIYYTTDVNVRLILSDPAETALLPEYAGLYSSIGVLVLWTAAIFGFVSAGFGRFNVPSQRRFLLSYSVIIGFLALDDLLMFHEWAGLLLARGFGANDLANARSALEAIVFAVYVFVILVWMWKSRAQIWHSPWPLMLLGGVGFAASIGLDLAPYVISSLENQPMRIETMIAVAEDLLKMLGIGGLAAYGVSIAIEPLKSLAAQATESKSQRSLGPHPKQPQ